MKSYNNVTIIGRVVQDVGIKEIGASSSKKKDGNYRASFVLAVDRPYKDSEGKHPTDFLNIVAWGKLGQICGDYVKKGCLVLVSGWLQSRSYEASTEDGKETETKWIVEIIAESINILEYKKEPKEQG